MNGGLTFTEENEWWRQEKKIRNNNTCRLQTIKIQGAPRGKHTKPEISTFSRRK